MIRFIRYKQLQSTEFHRDEFLYSYTGPTLGAKVTSPHVAYIIGSRWGANVLTDRY